MKNIEENNKNIFLYNKKIRNYENFLDFKENIREAIKDFTKSKTLENEGENSFIIFFINAYPINSYALGYLLKLKENDGIDIKIYTNEKKLKSLFETLELDSKFEISIKEP